MSTGDPSDTAPRRIATEGGAYYERISVAGNQYNYALDIDKLIAALRRALPAEDPEPERLLAALQQFQRLHARLHEWKELHNFLNVVVMTVDQFATLVERLDAQGVPADPRTLVRQWRPVALKVDLLLDWAAGVAFIAAPPFKRLDGGGMTGPPWAVELEAARRRLGDLLAPPSPGAGPALPALYDATAAFVDAANRHMYLVDKRLRETAGELYDLSRDVLGKLHRG
jgi:hypothetical protein